ncbi:putative transcriptional regulator SLK2 [Raphanus sativus]|nr:putative transcriptional regulator SLK2 [Raphanus sativus]
MYTVRKMPLLKARRYLEDVKANKQANRRAATIGKVPNLAKKKTLFSCCPLLTGCGYTVGCTYDIKFPCGVMVLEYVKAVLESVYEHINVVPEGHLRIIFSQVNRLLQVAENCQSTISGGSGQQQKSLSGQNMNCNVSMGGNRTDYGLVMETPNTTNRFRGIKGLDQSQNQEVMVSNTSINFENKGGF